jgi:hypothetical protein
MIIVCDLYDIGQIHQSFNEDLGVVICCHLGIITYIWKIGYMSSRKNYLSSEVSSLKICKNDSCPCSVIVSIFCVWKIEHLVDIRSSKNFK